LTETKTITPYVTVQHMYLVLLICV